jgi:tRNA-dihydrouridine synthase A
MSGLTNTFDRRISVAPMMDYTDRHCRYFMRLLSPSALLYTEMVTASAILRGDAERLLAFHPAEHPVALQLGGSDPDELARAARTGESFGYDEINLNCGCPSDRVQNGRFGACLMASPDLVADAVSAMRAAVQVPVTVKCRIGIEPRPAGDAEDFDTLLRFIEKVAAAGCDTFIVHARIAVLRGLSPKENREIPPLRHELVRELKARHPELQLILNGGLRSREQVLDAIASLDGAMIGREAYSNPYLLAELHASLHPGSTLPDRAEVARCYAQYIDERLQAGDRLAPMLRPIQGLFAGLPRVRSWRRYLSEQASRNSAGASVVGEALRIVSNAA